MVYNAPQNIINSGQQVGKISQEQTIVQQQPIREVGNVSYGGGTPLSQMGLVSLEEVQKQMAEQKSKLTLKIPTLPQGYKVIGGRLNERIPLVTDPISKRSSEYQSVELWIWNKDSYQSTTNLEILHNGGILSEAYGPGSNTTEQLRNAGKNYTYLWGHPASIRYADPIKYGPDDRTHIFVYHSGRQVSYMIISSLAPETLMRMMEEIVKDQ